MMQLNDNPRTSWWRCGRLGAATKLTAPGIGIIPIFLPPHLTCLPLMGAGTRRPFGRGAGSWAPIVSTRAAPRSIAVVQCPFAVTRTPSPFAGYARARALYPERPAGVQRSTVSGGFGWTALAPTDRMD